MYSLWVRVNAVVFYGLTVLIALAALCSFSTILHEDLVDVRALKINTLRSLRNHGGVDRALFSFDLKADLSPVWHWNTHVLFVYIVAEYKTEKNDLNQVVIWDKILEYRNQTNLIETNEFVKYALIDQGMELRGREVTLRLVWDHMPITGRVYSGTSGNGTYTFPSKYKG